MDRIPDVVAPGLVSAATGHHIARPGNRFWPALHRSDFAPRQLRPDEQFDLLEHGLGITNIVDGPSARADELTRAELVDSGRTLTQKVQRLRPDWLAVVGITAYRIAFAEPRATIGRQDRRRHHHLGPAEPERPQRPLHPRSPHHRVHQPPHRRDRPIAT